MYNIYKCIDCGEEHSPYYYCEATLKKYDELLKKQREEKMKRKPKESDKPLGV